MRMKKFAPILLLAWLSCGQNSTEPGKMPQIIVAPKVENISGSTADISWETDIAASSVVQYGVASGQLETTAQSGSLSTSHSIRLSGLKTGTLYFFSVTSTNKAGTATSAEFSFTTVASLDQALTAAWNAYQSKNYSQAISQFAKISTEYPTNAISLAGMGWCYIAPPIDSLAKGVNYFDKALGLQSKYQDALAGRGFALLAQKKYSAAISDLSKLLTYNAAYVFEKNVAINARQIRLALAMAYYYKQDYKQVQTQLDKIAPENGLHPNNSATWIVNGVTFVSYAEALLGWLEKLQHG